MCCGRGRGGGGGGGGGGVMGEGGGVNRDFSGFYIPKTP